jgi:hypothetical protein
MKKKKKGGGEKIFSMLMGFSGNSPPAFAELRDGGGSRWRVFSNPPSLEPKLALMS